MRSEAQRKADIKYKEGNKELIKYNRLKSAAKCFIRIARREDLEHLKEFIKRREAALNEEVKE